MKVVLTDHPWPDLEIERELCAQAGHELVALSSTPLPQQQVDRFVIEHRPDAILCCWAPVSAIAIRSSPNLRVVGRLGVGLDNIDVAAATAQGAWVTNVPDYCVEEVSDHVIGMLLAHARGIVHFDREAKLGHWDPASARLTRIRNMTIGLIGYGRIGRVTAHKLAQGFGSRVLVTSPSIVRDHVAGDVIAPGVIAASLDHIQQESDAIVLHLPLTDETRKLIDEDFLRRCKRKPLLINVSRGGLVDNAALIRALDKGLVRGAALDVIDGEPTPSPELLSRADVIVTPHIAFSSDASLEELRRRCTEDVLRVLRGESPLHPCNFPENRAP